ncbi:hypothetical protein [Microbacterium sp. NPDC076895]|uniref:hypothetical protein n=1 Tax=Microbacterium sp. NPDC076895 TaxID=3154957 RepID=UPI003429EFD9
MPSPDNSPVDGGELRVHVTQRPPAPRLAYVDQLVGAPGVRFRYSQRRIRRFDVDVIHVTDDQLDILLGTHGRSDWCRLLMALAFALAIRFRKVALVRTLLPSPEIRTSRAWLRGQRILDAATDVFVTPDGQVATPDSSRTVVIPYSHFRERFIGFPRAKQSTTGVLWATGAEHATEDIARPSQRIDVAAISDGALAHRITAAELVVVPKIDTLADLQMVFVALSLDRPVLTQTHETLTSLAETIGPRWLFLSQEPITSREVHAAITQTREAKPEPPPDLDAHDPGLIRNLYGETYARATHRRRRPKEPPHGAPL